MSTGATPPIEKSTDFGKGPQGEAARWLAEIDLFESEAKEVFIRYEKIVKRYRNESWRDDIPAATGADARGRGFAMFWANVETLKPTIYAQAPKADVQRRWKDKDPVARVASEILERCLDYFIDQPAFQDSIISCRDDYLIVGQGVQWHRYVPHFHDAKLRVPVRKKLGRGDGLTKTANTSGHAVMDQGLQVTNDAEAYEPDESEAYEAPDSEGQYADVEPSAVKTDAQGMYTERVQQEIQSEEWVPDYVYWRDFGYTPGARTWSEVYCVWRKCYLTRDELIDRFGEEVGNAVRLDYSPPKNNSQVGNDRDASNKQFYKKATVYEIWDSTKRRTYWLARAYDGDLLDDRPYPIKLTGRFPCQKPIFATQTNGQIAPVADYLQYQDQAQEMDRLTQRIYVLMDAIQVKAFYAANLGELQNLLQNSGENDMTPVDVSLLAQFNGDVSKAVWFFPIDVMVKALMELLKAREAVKADAYEITGISDIIRGSSDPNETLGAQELKAQSSSIRIKDKQKNFADFVRDACRIGADIITNHFQPDSIAEICDLKTVPEANYVMGPNGEWMEPEKLQALMQQQQQAMQQNPAGRLPTAPNGQPTGATGQLPGATGPVPAGAAMMGHNGGPPMGSQTLGQAAIALLKDPLQRNFRIDIETDSTIALDQNTEKQARVEFVSAIGEYLTAAMNIASTPAGQELAPLLGEILLFAVRGFKVGTQLEGAIESFVEEAQAKAKNPAPPQPDPDMIMAQEKTKQIQLQGQIAQQKAQAEQQRDAVELQNDQARMAMEQQQGQQELQHEREKQKLEIVKIVTELMADRQRANLDMAVAQTGAAHQREMGAMKVDQAKEMGAIKAKQAAKPKPTNGAAK